MFINQRRFKMISLEGTPIPAKNNRYKFSFRGLSDDTKPTEEFKGKAIANASIFIEIDTKSVSYYDEENEQWV